LHAAHEAFSSDGLEVSMAEIARRAGVGFATAPRRFPTKEDLVRAIFLEELSALRTATERAAAVGDDPWEAFAAPIRVCAAHQAEHPGLSGMIVGMVDAAAASENTIASFFAEIADQAVRVGILRAGVTLNDVLAI